MSPSRRVRSITDRVEERNRLAPTGEMRDLVSFVVDQVMEALDSERGAELWRAAKKKGSKLE